MYLTTYITNHTKPQTDYNSIMQQSDSNTEIITYKTTIKIDNPVPIENLSDKQFQHIINVVTAINKAYDTLSPFKNNYTEQYYEFKIPKRTGGLRTINAPKTEFKEALSTVKDIFEQQIKCLPHDAAYAYVKFRSTYDAIEKHQKNNSNWYLKLDLTDFFPSCTPEFIYNQLTQLYPFYYITQYEQETTNKLKEIIKICCLNNGLPQGTPMSPLLTNLVMVPYDYEIHNTLKRGLGDHFVYTRYADDILISSKSAFDWKYIQTIVSGCLRHFQIKEQKTRYGSKAGSNWNLGLMLNKDNNITLGHNKKKILNAMLNNFLKDFHNNTLWSKQDVYELQGQLSYLVHIEPEYYTHIKNKYQEKYNTNLKTAIKTILN